MTGQKPFAEGEYDEKNKYCNRAVPHLWHLDKSLPHGVCARTHTKGAKLGRGGGDPILFTLDLPGRGVDLSIVKRRLARGLRQAFMAAILW